MAEYKYLNNIKSPDDLKHLNLEKMYILADEIRDKLINVVSKNGGHLSSNLGTVELTIALHKCFSCKDDSIVWDVGHQAYTHKLLTGRYEQFDTIRQENGLSGFPKRDESKYDSFNVGHSSTSISAAYGIARGKELNSKKAGYSIAVIGDGALTGGLAYEGLNNAGRSKKNFIVVLNDNNMSITKNVGSVAKYLTNMRTSIAYLRIKRYIEKVLIRIPLLGKPLRNLLLQSKSKIREKIYNNTIFDDLGFIYYGPVDGHNINKMMKAFNTVKRIDQPVLVHVITKKGKGYSFAEQKPNVYHGISKFNIDSGEPISGKKDFSKVFGDEMVALAEKDTKLCAITAAMASGTGLIEFYDKFKNRFFDVGIAEEHAVTFACGLATENTRPVFAVYSTFLQRSYDQILHDASAQNLHIVLAVDRAGIVGEDGETHQGIFDVSFLGTIPNVTVYSPTYFEELKDNLYKAIYDEKNIAVVRYPRGGEGFMPSYYQKSSNDFDIYGDEDSNITVITYGRIFSNVCEAYEQLSNEGIKIKIIKLNKILPLNESLNNIILKDNVIFFEEGIKSGGIGEKLLINLYDSGFKGMYKIIAIPNEFVTHSTVDKILNKYNLDKLGIIKQIKELIEELDK